MYRKDHNEAMGLDLRTAVTLFMWLALVFAFLAMATRWIRLTHPGLLLVLSLFFLSLRTLAADWINIVCAKTGITRAAISLSGRRARVFSPAFGA